jgi:hypothetical protein
VAVDIELHVGEGAGGERSEEEDGGAQPKGDAATSVGSLLPWLAGLAGLALALLPLAPSSAAVARAGTVLEVLAVCNSTLKFCWCRRWQDDGGRVVSRRRRSRGRFHGWGALGADVLDRRVAVEAQGGTTGETHACERQWFGRWQFAAEELEIGLDRRGIEAS